MSKTERFIACCRRHVLLVDSLGMLLLGLVFLTLVPLSTQDMGTNEPGLLFDNGVAQQLVWSWLVLLPTAARRWKPEASTLAYVALVALHLVFGPILIYPDLLAPLMLYSVIVYGNPQHSTIYVLISLAMSLCSAGITGWVSNMGSLLGSISDPDSSCSTSATGQLPTWTCARTILAQEAVWLAVVLLIMVSTIIIAYWQRARLATIRLMQERNAALEASREEDRRIAALAERARIARDMHDVVAHTLSILIVQADGGRYAGTHDQQLARQTMETIRREAERALHDMKRLLGVFGGSINADFADMDKLLDQARQADPECSFSYQVTGRPQPEALGRQGSTTAYRLVQEALTNIRKYAGPQVKVSIEAAWKGEALELQIRDNGRGAAAGLDGHQPGYGLIGMRERVEALGGRLSTGPIAGGGYKVEAVIPIGSAPVASKNQDSTGKPDPHDKTPAKTTGGKAWQLPIPASRRGKLLAPLREFYAGRSLDLAVQPVSQDSQSALGPNQSAADTTIGKQISGSARRHAPNWIERVSRWTQLHYFAMDLCLAAFLILVEAVGFCVPLVSPQVSQVFGNTVTPLELLCSLISFIPLGLRRRLPEASAFSIAIMGLLGLFFFNGYMPEGAVFVHVFIYSVTLYGSAKARPWTMAFILLGSLSLGLTLGVRQLGYQSLSQLLTNRATADALQVFRHSLFLPTTLASTATALISCLAAMAMALWRRSSGSNALILRDRQEALMAEQAKERTFAANLERERISTAIQSEVSVTLTRVIDQAVQGLQLLDQAQVEGRELPAQSISRSFASIAHQARQALARMRELLGILRQTGSSDDDSAQGPVAATAQTAQGPQASQGQSGNQGMQLAPSASLDEQLAALKQRADSA
ncbi:sensor histidine kinase [Bifidobacterium aemilianum]|uniref:histidine kinase n=1 Tax=Bifidobacterium aemilianum TaxID=2493120 RepID=A0A366K8Y4_9BIFI|nr:histidine kinase [Bifidobacterium aemilianum]RBP98129.1 sensor histidine kinase [Bifidobacterium aemilianum]